MRRGLQGYRYSTRRRFEQLAGEGLPRDPVETRVRCRGALHRITLVPTGQLVLHDHGAEDTIAKALAGTEEACRCEEVIARWREVCTKGGGVSGLPEGLRDVALARYVVGSFRRTNAAKLQMEREKSIECERAPVYSRTSYRVHTRRVDQLVRRWVAYQARVMPRDAEGRQVGHVRGSVSYDGTYGRLDFEDDTSGLHSAPGKRAWVSLGCVARAIRMGSSAFAIDQRGRELHLVVGEDGNGRLELRDGARRAS